MTELDLFIKAYKLLDWKREQDYKLAMLLANTAMEYIIKTLEQPHA